MRNKGLLAAAATGLRVRLPSLPKIVDVPPSDQVRLLLETEPSHEAVVGAVRSCSGGWAIDEHFARLVANAIQLSNVRSVLEFGAGSSSLLIATVLDAQGGGRLTSIEQDPAWCEAKWLAVEAHDSVDSKMLVCDPIATLGRMGLYACHRHSAAELERRAPFDLVVVDGPQFFHGREGALPLSYNLLSEGGLILLDDAARPGERWAVWKWLETYPGLRLEYWGGENKGVAVLRKIGSQRPRLSLLCFLIGLRHGYLRWRRRAKWRRC